MDLNFITGSINNQNVELHGALVDLDNAVLALFWSGDKPVLGTLTVTLPDRSSSSLIGERDSQISLILGSQVAKKVEKMTLVSVNLPSNIGMGVSRLLIGLVKDLLDRLEERR